MGPATPPINTAHYTNLTVQSNVTFINHFHGTSREPQASTASWSEGAPPLGTPQLRDTTKLVLTTGDPYNAEYCTVDGHIRYRMVLRSRRLLLWESRRWVTVDKAVSTGSPAGGGERPNRCTGNFVYNRTTTQIGTASSSVSER
jgi:hypothetical protein